jgi:uncharacterized protein (TIGR02246 family)
MKNIIFLALFCLLSISWAVAQNAEDEKAVKATISKMQDLWNKHDINAYNNMHTEDATLVNPEGVFCANKAEIVKMHLQANEVYFKFTSVAIDIQKMRFVSPEVALVNVKYNITMTGEATMADGTRANKGDKHSAALLHVLVKKNGSWQISATQVTGIQAPAK